ncbi:MAG TPA: hypothetical protein VGF91_08990 [Solirubrobacteraceae bacterium]|jgi:hypothetical protein
MLTSPADRLHMTGLGRSTGDRDFRFGLADSETGSAATTPVSAT